MPYDKRKFFAILSLFLLLTVALAMRLQQWNSVQVPDEDAMLNMTMHLYDNPFPAGNYPSYPGWPPLFLYFNFLLSLIYQKILLFFGAIQFPAQFIYSPLGHDFVLKAGRIVSALAGTALVALAWRMGREFFGRSTAWLAALLMTVNSILVFDAHIFKPDTLMALLLCASLYFALKHDREARWSWLIISSLLFGLAVAAKYNSAVEFFFLFPAFLFTCRRNRQPLWKAFLMAPASMALGFFAGAPNWIVHPFLNIAEAYRFVTYHYSSFRFYEKNSAYASITKTILECFGPVLSAFLLVGLVAIVFNRRRSAILIAAYIIVYIAILGNTSYFGARMLLPLLPAAALIIASFLFYDLPRLLGKLKQLLPLYRIIAWGLLAFYAANGAVQNIRRFNLLSTASTFDQATDYRFRHIPFRFPLARENLTPGFAGDQGFSDLTTVPGRLFRGPDAMRFLCTGIFTRYILEKTPAVSLVHRRLKRNLSNYAVIERIHKPRFSSFDDDITYWYKKPGWVKELNLDRPLPHLPPIFSLPPSELASDTCYLPLQNFEKSPLAGKIAKDIWTKKIHSSRPLSRIVFYVLANGTSQWLSVAVNGKKGTFALAPDREICQIVFDHIHPQFLHQDYIYAIELAVEKTRLPIFLACVPEFDLAPQAAQEGAVFESPQGAPLPDLFSAAEAPAWCREVYRVSGIDPILHCFTQTERLLSNPERSGQDMALDDFPLLAGHYLVRIKGQKLETARPQAENLKLKWSAIGQSKKGGGEFALSLADMASEGVFPIRVDEMTFVQFSIQGQYASNFRVDELSIEPDYLAYINSYWLKKQGKNGR